MNELTAKLQKLYAVKQQLQDARQIVHDLQVEFNQLQYHIGANMSESVAYPIDGAIAIRHDCESNDIDFYSVVKNESTLVDSSKFVRDIVRIIAVEAYETPVNVRCIIPGFSLTEIVDISLGTIQQDLPDYDPKVGDRLIAEVLQGVENAEHIIVKNFQIAPADPTDFLGV